MITFIEKKGKLVGIQFHDKDKKVIEEVKFKKPVEADVIYRTGE